MAQFVSPNLWTLSGGVTHIRYSTEPVIFGGTHFSTQEGSGPTRPFSGTDIRSVQVQDIGTLISVTLERTIDTGSTTFTLLLPRVNLIPQGAISSAPVSTISITTHHSGPLTPPFPFGHGQQDFYDVIDLTGPLRASRFFKSV
jgi:hypothetical protein